MYDFRTDADDLKAIGTKPFYGGNGAGSSHSQPFSCTQQNFGALLLVIRSYSYGL